MTSGQRDLTVHWLDRAVKIVTVAGGLIVIITAIVGGISWWSGGLKFGTQVSADELTTKVNGIEATVGKIKERVDAFPRTSDFAAQAAFNEGVNNRFNTLTDKIQQDELKSAALVPGWTGFYKPPEVRQPRN